MASCLTRPYQCGVCHGSFCNSKDLEHHVTSAHEEGEKKEFHSTLFVKKTNIIKTLHDKKKHFCSVCKKGFATKGTLATHTKSFHQHPCGYCGKNYQQNSSLLRHIREVHNKPKKISCKVYKKELATKGSLQTHINCFHDDQDEKPFQVGSIVTQHSEMHKTFRDHQREESGCQWLKQNTTRQYSCNGCTVKFETKQILIQHFNIVHRF